MMVHLNPIWLVYLTKDEGENHVTELCLQVYREHLGLPEAGAGKEGSSEASLEQNPASALFSDF